MGQFSRPPKLCEQCRTIFESGSAGERPPTQYTPVCGHTSHPRQVNGGHHLWRVHHTAASSMAAAMAYGCEFCLEHARLATKHFQLVPNPILFSWQPGATCVGIGGMADQGTTWTILFQDDTNGLFDSGAILRLCDHDNELGGETNHLPPATLISFSTGSRECIDLAKHWLAECLNDHEDCPNPSIPTRYPTRLLRLEDKHAILIDSAIECITEPYATLSHCWGKKKFTVLTPATMDMFRQGQPIDGFLPTFRDAMLTAQRLGISYIWIDCLCIIQGTSDWDVEAGRMCDVYAGSLINLGAGQGTSPRGGLFVKRNPEAVKKRRIQWQPTNDREERLYDIHLPGTSKPGNDFTSTEALYSRAWVAQERILCHRMLHFGKDQIRWECPTAGCLSEINPIPMTEPIYNRYDSDLGPAELRALQDSDLTVTEKCELASELWYRVLKTYARLALTYSSDKLPAIQGVADFIKREIGQEYIYGFFENSLPKALGFRRNTELRISMSAPSWSWASRHGAVTLPLECMSNVPGEMLAAYTYCLRQTPTFASIFCIGKLLPIYKTYYTDPSTGKTRKDRAYLHNQLLGRWSSAIEEDYVISDEERLWLFPICARRTSGDRELPIGHPHIGDQIVYLKALVLSRTKYNTFRRHGNCNLWLNYDGDIDACMFSVQAFLEMYRSAKTRMVIIA